MVLLALSGCAGTPNIPAAVSSPDSGAGPGPGTASAPGSLPGPSVATAPAAAPPDLSVLRPVVRERYRSHVGDGGNLYEFDPAHSDIRIYAFRAGTAARFGHNHVLTAPHFSGLAWAPA